jgi:opacity protein-like surface antigen
MCSALQAQKHQLYLVYGFADNYLESNQALIGSPSYDGKGMTMTGLHYQYQFNRYISVETGLEYSYNKFEKTPAPNPTLDLIPQPFNIELLSIPAHAKLTLWKYFFINAGPLIDMELTSTGTQSGIGYAMGLGVQIPFKSVTVFANPFYQRHAVTLFSADNSKLHLTESGVKFGIGYKF